MSTGLNTGLQKAREVRMSERRDGIAWARAWRERMMPLFDAYYARPSR